MPRQEYFSCVNANIDNLTTKKLNVIGSLHPYSQLIAHTESLPEEGYRLSVDSFIPFKVNVSHIALQVNQDLVCDSKIKVTINQVEYIFTMSSNQSTMYIKTSFTLSKETLVSITIENMKDDEGDISTCTLFLYGTAEM